MNCNRYRLVFNASLGMMVPVAETARRRGKTRAASGPALALAGILLAGPAGAQSLPTPCAGGACGVNPNPTAFVASGAASYSASGTLGVVTQTSQQAILNWQDFNVGSGHTLQFVQPNAGAAALNRIWQGDASVIAGALQANGQIYLVNQNGIVFADGAQVNVGSLVAGTLDISDELFANGIPSNTDAGTQAAFAAASGSPGGLVKVESGAELKTATGGRVMLLAENVENHGLIETPEGQTILAAGNKVYLAVSDDPNLRGFLVEVDNGGTAANTGRVIAERGNISMTGLMVNQSGSLTATTSVNLNGSIRLMARDTVSALQTGSAGVTTPVAGRTGELVFGEGSVTEVLPEVDSSLGLSDEQTFNPSVIEGVGRVIHVQGDSSIVARGGQIDLEARAGQVFQDDGAERVDEVRIQVDDGALLDVSGLDGVSVAVERNYIEVELRGSQLADSPLQRNTFLNKSKVWIDIEQGTPLADVSADIAKIERTVAEKSAVGGSIDLRSEGDLVLQSGAVLDVSGGSIAYSAGFGRTTTLIQDGTLVNIGDADPNQIYDGFADRYVIYDAKWNTTETIDLGQTQYIEAYTAGRDAGQVNLTAHGMVVDATLIGGVETGPYQREAAPAAGELALTLLAGSSQQVTALPDLQFVSDRLGAPQTELGEALPDDVALSVEFLSQGGFGAVTVDSKGRVVVPEAVTLDAGAWGRVDLTGRRIDVEGDILAAGGVIRLESTVSPERETADAADFAINIGPDALLDVAGLWINDLPGSPGANSGPVVLDGGRIELDAHADLNLAAGSVLEASAGAQVTNAGILRTGAAGSIDLASGDFGVTGNLAQTSRIALDGELRAYGFGEGGDLALRTSSIRLGETASGAAGELLLDEAFFTRGGFDAYDLTGVEGLTVSDGFVLEPSPLSAQLRNDFGLQASSRGVAGMVDYVTLPSDFRAPTQVRLAAENLFRGAVSVGEAAVVRVDPQGSIDLVAGSQLTVLGTLEALAGHIGLRQTALQTGEFDIANYDAGRSIFLGENSQLLVTGTYLAEPDPQGLRKGTVTDGGTVEIEAAKGYLVMQQGARIDASGTRTVLDLVGSKGLAATTVASDGGSILLSAREGMLLEGSLHAAAGGEQAQGGSLDLRIDPMGGDWDIVDTSHPLRAALYSQRRVIVQDAPTALTAGLAPGDALDTLSLNGELRIAAAQIEAGGFDNLAISAADRIAFDGDVALDLAGRLTLYAPNLSTDTGAQVHLSAASVIAGSPEGDAQGETRRSDASGGAGVLAIDAGLIELVGHSSLQGFGQTTLTSANEIRTLGVVYDADLGPGSDEVEYVYRGSLVTGGDLTLAARQVYPVSLAEFALEIHNNPAGRITVTSTGEDSPVLSAGGKLTLAAPEIVQGGTLKAPFGEIVLRAEEISRVTNGVGVDGLPTGSTPVTLTRTLAAEGEVTLVAGSLTSVSAEGQLIPFGTTELSGDDWIYDFGLYKEVIEAVPEKQVTLEGERVTQDAGAVIDLSGGGDLFAYEFLKGPGGSQDVLLPENSEGLYAILPGLGSDFAAYDANVYAAIGNWNPGDSVQLLQGTQGLAAGSYALLPARYALLPGAYMVRIVAEDTDQPARVVDTLPGGATRVAGYVGSVDALGEVNHGARTATLEISPGSVARSLSEYLITEASVAFANQSGTQQPGDAGRLSIAVGEALSLGGELLAGHEADARGAEVDISADRLAVTSDGSSYAADYVTLSVEQLDALGASSLLLGGGRRNEDERSVIEQRSDTVVIANDADHALAAPEVILVARDAVILEAGALVAGEGLFAGATKNLHVSDASGNADGALLRVSTGGPVGLTRDAAQLNGGVLDIAAGATVRAGQSAILDATLDNRTLGQVELPENGGALTLGATRIALAENGAAVNPDGLVFDQTRLAELGNPAHLVLRSYSTLDLYGDVTLGDSGLESLRIEAAGIGGFGAAGETASLVAGVVTFANPDGLDAASAFAGTTGSGNLDVQAGTVALGTGDFTLRGFDRAALSATDEISGQGGRFAVEAGGGAGGHLDLDAGRITTAAGVDQTVSADGDLGTAATGAAPATDAAMGGRLDLIGASVTHGGRIDMPAGRVSLHATQGDVTLLDGSAILAGGRAVDFADTVAFAPGGSVQLVAEQGRVSTGTGSLIDVAGDALGGDAGELTVWAAGDAVLAGTLRGDAASGYDSGRFTLEAAHIGDGGNDFSALNAVLEAGGFHASRRLRVREGDVAIAATDSVTAADFRLSADAGDIVVAGVIDASGDKGGQIKLYAGQDLTLAAGASLLARADEAVAVASGTAGEGGQVELGSGESGTLNLDQDSLIDVSVAENSAAREGRVRLRVARTGDSAALGTRAGSIVGAEAVEVEAYRVYAGVTELVAGTTSGSQLGLASVQGDNDAYVDLVDLSALQGGLDIGDAGFHLLPGVEVRNEAVAGVADSGDIQLAGAWNLNSLRHNGEAGVLTVRAGGDLDLAASLSDGFSTADSSGLLQSSPVGWSLRLVAGADALAADPLATRQDAGESALTLAANVLVRTGTGEIDAVSAGDLLIGSGAALYSAGYASVALTDFTLSGLTGTAFPTGGGDVRLAAAGTLGSETGPGGLLTDWLYRQGNTTTISSVQFRDPAWWPQINQFKNGVGTLGGGDVSVQAGGTVANLLAVAASNARQPATLGQTVDPGLQVILGGGDLLVRAGGDIEGGLFHVDLGTGSIETGASLAPGLARGSEPVGTVLSLGDARIDVVARTDAQVEAVLNPTLVPQVSGNLAGTGGSNRESYFVSYSDASAVGILSVAGETGLRNDFSAQTGLALAYGLNAVGGLGFYPGTLEAVALQGNVVVNDGFTLMPSAVGDLRLLAGLSVIKLGGNPLHLSDMALDLMPTLDAPIRASSGVAVLTTLPEKESDGHGPERLHEDDPNPVYVVAREGDIVGQSTPEVFAILAKPAVFQAGGDIINATVVGQNLAADDVTRFVAGGDIVFAIDRDPIFGEIASISNARIAIGGPGRLEIIAGGSIDLGASLGVLTRGNLANPYLPEGGADLLVVAGATAHTGEGEVLPLDTDAFSDAALDAFFAELAESAVESVTSKDYSRGEAAIEALFPTGTEAEPLTYAGDISLFFSQIKTEQGGDIRLLAPGGSVNAGLASVTGFTRAAADLGVLTVQGGDIEAYTLDDFEVNSSRVFTISGGDILLWSALGDIDAGKGAKTASATPPPRLRIDGNGNFVLDVSQSIAGSGIGALDGDSDVVLVAPSGEVNAGDAGIRAGGNLTIAALQVVGADNIQVGGVSTGVPISNDGAAAAAATSAGNIGTDASSATASLSQNLADAVRAAEELKNAFKPTFISAEVIGHGE